MAVGYDIRFSRNVSLLLEAGFWTSLLLAAIDLPALVFFLMLINQALLKDSHLGLSGFDIEDIRGITTVLAYAAIPFIYIHLFLRGRRAFRDSIMLSRGLRYFAWVMLLLSAAFLAGYVNSLIAENAHGDRAIFSPAMIVFGPVLVLAFVSWASLASLLVLPSPYGSGVVPREAS